MNTKFCIKFYHLPCLRVCKRDFVTWLKSNVFSIRNLVSEGVISLIVHGYFCNLVFVEGHVYLRAIGDEMDGLSCGVNIKIK